MSEERDGLAAVFERLRSAVEHLPPEIRHRAKNAFEGFVRAKRLLGIDPEMASFRAITAEEEAAAALFRSLQLRSYPGADQLDIHRHVHKAAVAFFTAAAQNMLIEGGPVTVRITLQEKPPELTVALPVSQFFPNDPPTDLQLVCADPLGIVGSTPGVADENYFDQAIAKIAGDRKIDKLIAKAANARNKLLYAHDGGVPASAVTLEAINIRERRAEILLLLSIAILQVPHHQGFALQCLRGFLKIIRRARADVYT